MIVTIFFFRLHFSFLASSEPLYCISQRAGCFFWFAVCSMYPARTFPSPFGTLLGTARSQPLPYFFFSQVDFLFPLPCLHFFRAGERRPFSSESTFFLVFVILGVQYEVFFRPILRSRPLISWSRSFFPPILFNLFAFCVEYLPWH